MRSWGFFGSPRQQNSEAHEILKNYFEKIYLFIGTNIDSEIDKYFNIENLVNQHLNTSDENSYFWNWMDKHGLELINELLHANLNDEDEFLDLLDHRLYILDADIASGLNDNVFTSIADSLKYINDFVTVMNETTATVPTIEATISSGTFRTGPLHQPMWNFGNNFIRTNLNNETFKEIWKNSLNPAEIQQDFCYYLVRE